MPNDEEAYKKNIVKKKHTHTQFKLNMEIAHSIDWQGIPCTESRSIFYVNCILPFYNLYIINRKISFIF